jgi:hypothetical protein
MFTILYLISKFFFLRPDWIIPEMDEIDDLHQQFVKKYFE